MQGDLPLTLSSCGDDLGLFGSAVELVFDQILNFFLLKLSAVCIFWIVLMC
jgi:hypothetical protein